MSQKKELLNIGIVCGEHSGDRLGADLINEIKHTFQVNLYGVGGPKLEALGVKSEFNFSELNIMGLIDPLINYRKLTKLRNNLINLFLDKNIDFFIGIDSPDFNMGIHKALKKNHTNKNIQVVSPSVWAWRQNRIKSIQDNIDLTLCLFNFEDNYYKKVGHKSLHLGHPFSKLQKSDVGQVFSKYNLDESKEYISILPGSRKSEINNLLPTYIDFIKEYSKRNQNYFFLIPAADKKSFKLIDKHLTNYDLPVLIKDNAIRDFLSISNLSIATSGTATLESAILECPPIICYKTNFFNYLIISRMLKMKDVGLPNLLLGDRKYSELIQSDCNVANIIQAAEAIQKNTLENSKYAELLRNTLIGKGNSEAAKVITTL